MVSNQPNRSAILVASNIPRVNWNNDFIFDEKTNVWIGTLSVELTTTSPYIPHFSLWYCLIDREYPFGNIRFYPCKTKGVKATFPHQDLNRLISNDSRWLSGKPCLTEPFGKRRQIQSRDPIGDSDLRLAWYTSRLVAWLDAAASSSLILVGEHFELPEYPKSKISSIFIHDESDNTFQHWRYDASFGRVELGLIDEFRDNIICIASFLDGDKTIRSWQGRTPKLMPTLFSSYWILCPSPIILPPWKAPETWGELRSALKVFSINLDAILQQIAKENRNNGRASILFTGYPIPFKHGDPPKEIFWSGILIPKITDHGPAKGFRSNELGFWMEDRRNIFSDSSLMNYVSVENWSKDRLCSRGRLPEDICQLRCAVIGLGSLGSQVALSIARMGVNQIALIDGDLISAGNITRHIATLQDVGKFKTNFIGDNIRAISPHIKTICYPSKLSSENALKILDDSDIVIDCTGDDEVCRILESKWFSMPKMWVCACIGYKASYIYIYTSRGHCFPADEYFSAITPWLEKNNSKVDPDIVEGAGCWHPLFPARQDDVLLASALCTKILSEAALDIKQTGLRIFEQQESTVAYNLCQVYPS